MSDKNSSIRSEKPPRGNSSLETRYVKRTVFARRKIVRARSELISRGGEPDSSTDPLNRAQRGGTFRGGWLTSCGHERWSGRKSRRLPHQFLLSLSSLSRTSREAEEKLA